MMTLEEQKLAVCEKLPDRFWIPDNGSIYWQQIPVNPSRIEKIVNWVFDGLQVCHEAEKLLTYDQKKLYLNALNQILARDNDDEDAEMVYYADTWDMTTATYEQRLEALTRVWFPEKWK